ncbi:MAG: Glu-tRNA(Gln) amidotransferase subunit GatE [Candidatus Thermoplasmatota archaeon]|nr:Glu-tRNA(Gln) amidotransferase subunit GatE [Candidatus Thermoplasmatota archaeon]
MKVKIGLEIHQQLDTGKLFCACPSKLVESKEFKVMRKLRLAESELGAIDRAALFESERAREHMYASPAEASCLVELDEEPPHEVNREALRIALQISKMLEARIFDVICFMRKIVIDGSNTSGFQRTALIACDGKLENTGIATICLEEDSARKVREEGNRAYYNLDRLGVPLVEIATEPTIESAEEAQRVAYELGMNLRRAKVKRGLGTIRQDLNISVDPETGIKANRVEIKGVQRLSDIEGVIKNEIERQKNLYAIREILAERADRKEMPEVKDLSDVFKETRSNLILKAPGVYGIKLSGFRGLLSMGGELRVAKELVSHSGLKGILHGDELPGYGISAKEVEEVKKLLDVGKDDSFVIVLERHERAKKALELIFKRALECFDGVPAEVRRAAGLYTEYMRPMPGSERMYPETDVPYMHADTSNIEIPPTLEERKKELIALGANEQQCYELMKSGYEELFENLVKESGEPQVVLRILNNTLVELEREGMDTSVIDIEILRKLMDGYTKGLYTREAIEEILKRICERKSFEEAVAPFKTAEQEEVEAVVSRIVEKERALIEKKGRGAFRAIMGEAMRELRGKVDGKTLSDIVRKKIEEAARDEAK